MSKRNHPTKTLLGLELPASKGRAMLEEMIEEVTLDFIAANNREPVDDRELADWCKGQVESREDED